MTVAVFPRVFPRLPPGPDSGLAIIIVGAGIAGLAMAIECRLMGHKVTLFERAEAWKELGDSLDIMNNSGRVVVKWGVDEELRRYCGNPGRFECRRNKDGKLLYCEGVDRDFKPDPMAPYYMVIRTGLHKTLLDRAVELGADIVMGARISTFEDTTESASIVTEDGIKHTADIVVGADGFNSKARAFVLGYDDPPFYSGYHVFRTKFPAKIIKANPLCAHMIPDDEVDFGAAWIGNDVHFICVSLLGGTEFSWVMTRQTPKGEKETSWSSPGSVEEALAVVKDWDPVVSAIISCTPPESLIDWGLAYREPLPTWSSANGRTVLVGDAAHPHIPTAEQGASQSIESACVLANCLSLAKAKGQPLSVATKVYQNLRYERVRSTQALGVEHRQKWHQTDLWAPDLDIEKLKLNYTGRILDFDCFKDAHEKYDDEVAKL